MPSDQPVGLYGNYLGCHIIKNYIWVFTIVNGAPGYVKKR